MTKSFSTGTALQIVEVFGVALLWYLLFKLNIWLFSNIEYRHNVNWIFLPAAVRVLAVVLFGWRAALGLFIGAMFTATYEPNGVGHAIVSAAISALAPMIAVLFVSRMLKLAADLKGLTFEQLAVLSFAGSGLCAVAHITFYSIHAQELILLWGFFPMFVGDLVGTMLVLYAAHFAMRLVLPSHTDKPM